MATMIYSVVEDLQNPLLTGVGQAIVTRDDTFEFLDTLSIEDSIQHKYNRELSLGSTGAAFVAPGSAVTASAATVTPVVDNIKECIAAVQVPKLFSNPVQLAYQIGSKTKDIRRAFGNSFINGAGSDDLTGLKTLCAASQVVSASTGEPADLTLGMLDSLVRAVSVLNMPSFIVMNRVLIDKYRDLLRTQAGGLQGNQIQMRTLGGDNKTFLTVQGVPVIASDWIAIDETFGASGTDSTSAYAVYSNVVDGLHLFYSTNPGAPIVNVDGPKPIAGSNATGYDATFNVGMSLKSTFALARLVGVKTPA